MKELRVFETTDGKLFHSKEKAIEHEHEIDGCQDYTVELYFEGCVIQKVRAHNKKEAIAIAENKTYMEDISFEEVEAIAYTENEDIQ